MQKLPLFFLFCILHLTLRVFFEALFLSVHFKLSSSITQNRVFEYSWAASCAVDRRAEFFLPGEDCLRTDIAVHAGRCPFLHFFYKGRSAFWRTVPLGGCDAITEFPVDGQLIADFSILRCAEKFLQTARQIFAPDSVLCDCLSG